MFRERDSRTSYLTDSANRLATIVNLPIPFPEPLKPADLLWLHDTTAFRQNGSYNAEFLASFFRANSGEKVSEAIAWVASKVKLTEKDSEGKRVLEERMEAFLNQIVVGRTVDIQVVGGGIIHMGPGGSSGISSETVEVPFERPVVNGESVRCEAVLPEGWNSGPVAMSAFVAEPGGWAVLSDIDDTIKVTEVLNIPSLLRNTFIETEPAPTPSFPSFYSALKSNLDPVFIYLSASPYNLYPFLHSFVNKHYPPGQIILRDMSWMNVVGLIDSVSVGTQAYKTQEGTKVLSWLPARKWLCIGDSTQTDPETYGTLYRENRDKVKAIWIRLVSGVDPKVEKDKNSPSRFERAFTDVPKEVWRTFTDVSELSGEIERLKGL